MLVDKMHKLLSLLALLAAASAQVDNLDDIVNQLSASTAPTANKNSDLSLITSEADDTSCTTRNNEVGECVPYYLCDSNGTIINNTLAHKRVLLEKNRKYRDGPCNSYLEACCYAKETPNNTITPPTSANKRVGCGWSNPDGLGPRIQGGEDGQSKFGEFPWMVAILKSEPLDAAEPDGPQVNVYLGGGSLIHPSAVLTAAQCVSTAGALRVRAGEWDTQTRVEMYPHQDRQIKSYVVHEDYNSTNQFYDIALLFLASPVEAAPNVGVACLPPPSAPVARGTRCLVSGWGKDVNGKEGRYQVILKRVELPVVDHASCESQLQTTWLGAHFRLHSNFMCAGGEPGRATCRGDEGSPLVCPAENDKDRFVQYGIVTWGIGYGDSTPGVNVDVSKLRGWIDDKMSGQGFDPNVYTLL